MKALLPALAALVACSGDGQAPQPVCGPTVTATDFDPAWLPGAPGLDASSATVPLDIDGLDDGHEGVSYGVHLAAHYHLRVQRPVDCEDEDGDPCEPFGYQYDPVDDAWEDDESTARQVVAALAQVRIYALLGQPEILVSATDALRLIDRRTRYNDTGAYFNDLGSTGLLAMATAEYERVTGSGEFATLRDELGRTVLANIAEDGSYPAGTALKFAQAQQALWRLYASTGDDVYLDALRLMARHAADNTDKQGEGEYFEFPYVYGLWANEALTELWRIDQEDWIADLVYFVGDDVMTRQYRAGAPGVPTTRCAWRGGFTPDSGEGAPNWNSTIKLEAMVDAWRMADLAGDADRELLYRGSAETGTAWLLSNQYRLGDTDSFAAPEVAIGGFPLFDTYPDVRIDIPGHGSIALAKAAAWLFEEDILGDFGP